MAKRSKTPEESANKWSNNLSAAGPAIAAGVNAVTSSPGQAAAKAKDRWLANLNASADRWAARLNAMPLDYWKQQMTTLGVQRIQQGASSKKGKMQAFLAKWLPYEQSVVAALPPRGNTEANIQRAVALMRKNAEAKGKFRGNS